VRRQREVSCSIAAQLRTVRVLGESLRGHVLTR